MHFCNGGNLIIGGLEQKKGGNNEDYLLKPFLLKLKKNFNKRWKRKYLNRWWKKNWITSSRKFKEIKISRIQALWIGLFWKTKKYICCQIDIYFHRFFFFLVLHFKLLIFNWTTIAPYLQEWNLKENNQSLASR